MMFAHHDFDHPRYNKSDNLLARVLVVLDSFARL